MIGEMLRITMIFTKIMMMIDSGNNNDLDTPFLMTIMIIATAMTMIMTALIMMTMMTTTIMAMMTTTMMAMMTRKIMGVKTT